LRLTLFYLWLWAPAFGSGGDSGFDWSTIPDLYPGVKHAEVIVGSPRPMVFNVLRIDAKHTSIRFHTTERHPDWGRPMEAFPQLKIRTGRQSTSAYLNRQREAGKNMIAAINASPWRPWSEFDGMQKLLGERYRYPFAGEMGLNINDGKIIDFANSRATGTLVFNRNGTIRILNTNPRIHSSPDTDSMRTAVSGFGIVLANGVASGSIANPQPRTGYGLGSEGRYLILLTVDGRQTDYSEGASLREVGDWLLFFGAWDGINMDGGGSTTMVLRDPVSGMVNVKNSPQNEAFEGGGERPVGNNFGIYFFPN